ncbi:hypothetical protein [Streptomyces pinistramenti]|uniref:hypothetical protein n=1 Tax=Streptomyces pinistramenti TaxID=2884812 RepID=UPI001D0840CF|nr:hypothetical protein [Streptomyces pinistramenti]MCB5910210.1 hypothetical protein [Streptomyces pinistramenti]
MRQRPAAGKYQVSRPRCSATGRHPSLTSRRLRRALTVVAGAAAALVPVAPAAGFVAPERVQICFWSWPVLRRSRW